MSNPHHQRNPSEPHSYNIQAKLQNGILSIYVHDTMTNAKWRQEFTQISFPGHKLYNVAKSLIMAIQQMINETQQQQNQQHSNINTNAQKPIAILVYNQWCYLTINNSNFPSFALRPIEYQPHSYHFPPNQPPKNQNDTKNYTQIPQNSANPKPSKTSTSSSSNSRNITKRRRKPIIVINKGVVARNIAKFSNQNSNQTYSSNSRRKPRSNKHSKKSKHQQPKKKMPSRPPPTLNASNNASISSTDSSKPCIGRRPGTPTPSPSAIPTTIFTPNKPVLPTIPIAHKMTVRDLTQRSSVITPRSDNNMSVKFGNTLSTSIHSRSNHMNSPVHTAPVHLSYPYQNISIPAPPVPKKHAQSMTPKKSMHQTYNFQHAHSQDVVSMMDTTQNYNVHVMAQKLGTISSTAPKSVQSGGSHLDLGSSSGDSDDGIMVNTDDEESDFGDLGFGHPTHHSSGSMQTGSLDSLFAHDAPVQHGQDVEDVEDEEEMDDVQDTETETETETEDEDSDETEDVDGSEEEEEETEEFSSDMFECEFSGKDDEYDMVQTPKRKHFRGFDSETRFRSKTVWNDDEMQCIKDKKKRKRKKEKLTICVNGEKIDDVFDHVIEQQIAEEEYYEEEEYDEPFYDPNYLGISPYDDY